MTDRGPMTYFLGMEINNTVMKFLYVKRSIGEGDTQRNSIWEIARQQAHQ